jgi:hypothetical protein
MAEILDAAILVWLIGTWFYEGHHRRCTVVLTCAKCGEVSDACCHAGDH